MVTTFRGRLVGPLLGSFGWKDSELNYSQIKIITKIHYCWGKNVTPNFIIIKGNWTMKSSTIKSRYTIKTVSPLLRSIPCSSVKYPTTPLKHPRDYHTVINFQIASCANNRRVNQRSTLDQALSKQRNPMFWLSEIRILSCFWYTEMRFERLN